MATYKVIQDIEAEDKLVGPFSLRQFIYVGIVVMLGFVAYQLFKVSPVIASPLILPILFFAALAAPLGQDQPSEVWLLAKIRFFLKPRRRIWNQDGISQLVTVTAPKKIEHHLTNGLSQTEVESRLSALANTLDSRGWAIKNVNVNLFSQAGYLNGAETDSDRLISPASLPQNVSFADVTAVDDIMDENTNPTAQNLSRLMQQSEVAHRQQVVNNMASAKDDHQPPADYWFVNEQEHPAATKPGFATFDHNPLVAPGQNNSAPSGPQTADEQALLNKLHDNKKHAASDHSHMKTILPLGNQPARVSNEQRATSNEGDQEPKTIAHSSPLNAQATKSPRPDIIRLANNDDLNIDTIAREAKRGHLSDDEVVVSLH